MYWRFLGCDHKLNKCLLFIARFETESLPTRFLTDCKSFLFLLFFIVLHFVYCSNEGCKMTRSHMHLFSFLYVYIPFFNLESFCLSSLYNHNLILYKLKMVAFFLDRCTNKRGFGKRKECYVVFEALKHEAPKVIISLFPY